MSLLDPAIGQVESNKQKTMEDGESYNPFTQSFLPCSLLTGIVLYQYILSQTSLPRWGMFCPKPNQKLCAATHEYSVLFSPKRN